VQFNFSGPIWHWRGPSPFHFVTVPERESAELAALANSVTYGWGMIPVIATVGATTWTTSLFPKDGGYLVPIRDSVRKAEQLDVDDVITIGLDVDAAPPLRRRQRE
jgi:hypothetical protein